MKNLKLEWEHETGILIDDERLLSYLYDGGIFRFNVVLNEKTNIGKLVIISDINCDIDEYDEEEEIEPISLHLDTISLDEIYQYKGYGKELITMLVDISKKTEIEVIAGECKEHIVEFYKKLGANIYDDDIVNGSKFYKFKINTK